MKEEWWLAIFQKMLRSGEILQILPKIFRTCFKLIQFPSYHFKVTDGNIELHDARRGGRSAAALRRVQGALAHRRRAHLRAAVGRGRDGGRPAAPGRPSG